MLNPDKVAKAHQLCQSIESDGVNAIHTNIQRHGEDAATIALVGYLRGQNPGTRHWPTAENVIEEVNKILTDNNLLPHHTPNVAQAVRLLVGGCLLAVESSEMRDALRNALKALDPAMYDLMLKDKEAAFAKVQSAGNAIPETVVARQPEVTPPKK